MKNNALSELPDLSQGFLSVPQVHLDQQGVRIIGRFELAAFSPDLFENLSIARPESLAGAIAKRQAEFLAGRCMAAAAQMTLGYPPTQVKIGSNRAPIWPAGLAGSISHARGNCASFVVPVNAGHPGIDIEAITSGQALSSIQRMVLNPQENEIIKTADMPVERAATLVFSAKETLFKALFPIVQRHFGFPAAALTAPPQNGFLSLKLTDALHADLPKGQEFKIHYFVSETAVTTWLLHQNPAR